MKCRISDENWQIILKILCTIKGIHTRDEAHLRKFIEGVYMVVRSGCQWSFVHPEYGKMDTIYRRFWRWAQKGIWAKLFEAVKLDPDMEYAIPDSTIVRAHACSAGYQKDGSQAQALGRSRGGHSTKIHILSDALGNPLKIILTPGQESDITQAKPLISDCSHSVIIADKGYDSDEFRDYIKQINCDPAIPARKNRKNKPILDKHLYGQRNVIEILIGLLKQYRRIFSRFDKSVLAFSSFIYFASALIWLR